MTYRLFMAIAALGAATSGCADQPAKTPLSATSPTGQGDGSARRAQGEELPGKDPNQGNIHIHPRLAKLCNVSAAYFSFDSANLSGEAKAAMDSLAKCFTTGAAKNETMQLVGHADPRGEPEYNFALGQRRAGTVEMHLTQRGVPADRIETSSRGELDAVGTNEASWAKDRKVEINLAD